MSAGRRRIGATMAGERRDAAGGTPMPPMTEKQLQVAVVNLARLLNWRVYHTFLSVRSAPGFPDLVMVRDGFLLFVEMKGPKGKVSEAQRAWLDELGLVQNHRVGVFVWTPEHWHNGVVEYVLQYSAVDANPPECG